MDNQNSPEMNDLELEAAAYVLGLSRGAERQEIQKRLAHDSELRYWVNWWEQRLFSLSLHPKPLSPRKKVWRQLSKRLSLQANLTGVGSQGLQDRFNSVRGYISGAFTGFAMAALFVLGAYLINANLTPPRDGPTHYASLESNGVLSYVIEQYADGHFEVAAVQPAATDDGQVLELWLIAENTSPVSLGLLPSEGSYQQPWPSQIETGQGNLILAISVEPKGGSPTGLPTGPVISSATLVPRLGGANSNS